MSLTRAVLKLAAPLPDVLSFERCLFIGPHPDDIEIGAGATAARLSAMGKSVCFLVCTDGRYGSDKIAPQELIEIRKKESIASARTLGVEDVRFMGLSDGGFYTAEELRDGMARVIGDFKPQMIFAPDPCVTSECHTDHLNVGETARRLAYFAPYADIMSDFNAETAPVEAIGFYMTAKPNSFVKISRELLSKQRAAVFNCHLSQFAGGMNGADSIALYLKLRAVDFGIRSLNGLAEGFRVLGTTQMHCLPEAGLF